METPGHISPFIVNQDLVIQAKGLCYSLNVWIPSMFTLILTPEGAGLKGEMSGEAIGHDYCMLMTFLNKLTPKS